MRRIQFIEIHEQPWFPPVLRDYVTEALQYGLDVLKAYAPIVPMLQAALRSARSRSIVDLCSGAGGPWVELSRELQKSACVRPICLSDKFPNLRAFQNLRDSSGKQLTFCADPVDATNVPPELTGFRTVFSSYHHFSPEEARAVLQDAVAAGQGVGIFEVTRRAPLAIALMFPWALLTFVFTPWIRPFRWSRLFWTYAIPVIPFVLLFDGVVSCLRTYRPKEMREIIEKLEARDYHWDVGEHFGEWGNVPITFLIGHPREGA
ncbi:MAG TPA: hypothetical protein VH161_10025 [Candidatus Acidoferrales bacterium]|nr:hypothetical protein [Candidatus Acidoferrales bacterium]